MLWFSPLQDKDDRAILMWVSNRILGNYSLFPSCLAAMDHPCKIPFCGSLGWERLSSATLETGTIHSFLVSCQTPYHKATRAGFCFVDFTELSVLTQRLKSFFISILCWHERTPKQGPFTWTPYSELMRLFVESAGFLISRWAFGLCWRTHPSSSPWLLCGDPTVPSLPSGPHSSSFLGHSHALAFSCLFHIQLAPSLGTYSEYAFSLPYPGPTAFKGVLFETSSAQWFSVSLELPCC